MTQKTDNPVTKFSFELIISAWQDKVRCEIQTRHGDQCRRPASWRADFHGCSRGLMCTQHMRAHQESVDAAFPHNGRRGTPCNWCGRTFRSPGAALTVTPL